MVSLLPLLLSAWWADLDRPHRLLDQNFGVGLRPEDLVVSGPLPLSPREKALYQLYYRPWADLWRPSDVSRGTSTVTADKDKFQLILDVQQFKPEEISVKVVDKFIVVEAKHEEKRDEHGTIARQFVRKYWVPDRVNVEDISSTISTDGILTITAPFKESAESNERTVKIEFTGKPALQEGGGRKESGGEGSDKESMSTTTTTSTTMETETSESTTEPPK